MIVLSGGIGLELVVVYYDMVTPGPHLGFV